MYIIEIASASKAEKPGIEMPKSIENWDKIVEEKTAKEALIALIGECNDENISIDNNWLRLKVGDENWYYG